MDLYVLIRDGGDGSYAPQFIIDPTVLEEIEELYDRDLWNFDNGFGCDGDGFHYSVIKVPEDSTAESLEISVFTAEDLSEWKEDYL